MDINSALKVLEGLNWLHEELTRLKELRDKQSGGEWSEAVKVRIVLGELTESSVTTVVEGIWPMVWVTSQDEVGDYPELVVMEDSSLMYFQMARRFELGQ